MLIVLIRVNVLEFPALFLKCVINSFTKGTGDRYALTFAVLCVICFS